MTSKAKIINRWHKRKLRPRSSGTRPVVRLDNESIKVNLIIDIEPDQNDIPTRELSMDELFEQLAIDASFDE
mgnify:CR=1 FL=1